MDHNLSYRGPILVIQKPNIKFQDRAAISLKDISPNSHFFLNRKSVPKIWSVGLAKTEQPVEILENGP